VNYEYEKMNYRIKQICVLLYCFMCKENLVRSNKEDTDVKQLIYKNKKSRSILKSLTLAFH